MKVFSFPFNPFPGFHWVLLLFVCLLSVTVNPEAMLTSILWFAVVSHNICDIICRKVVGVKFSLPSKYGKTNHTWMDAVMFIPFFIMMIAPVMFLMPLIEDANEYLAT